MTDITPWINGLSIDPSSIKVKLYTEDPSLRREFDDDLAAMREVDGCEPPTSKITWPSASSGTAWGSTGRSVTLSSSDLFTLSSSSLSINPV
jgi:hypothetical protein